MLKQLFFAGFGGQGVLSMGQILVYGGALEGKEVSWIPSYGPEMRGGTANCSVCISDKPISSPMVSEPDYFVVMNQPSLDKFEKTVRPGGVILVNQSLVTRKVQRDDVKVYYIEATETAIKMGNVMIANMIMLGALLKVDPIIDAASVLGALKKVWPPSKQHLLPLNESALNEGASWIK
jgi:2-oxoglutarate ferredoxin oxidoreductase subunit gamma